MAKKRYITMVGKIIFFILLSMFLVFPGIFLTTPPRVWQRDPPWIDAPFSQQSSSSIQGGLGIFVINLKNSPQRYQTICEKLIQLPFPFERVDAIYGKSLHRDYIESLVSLKTYHHFFNGRYPGVGEIGCFLSHRKAWKHFLNSPYKFALILEDDVLFTPETLRFLLDDLIKNESCWDVCLLGHSSYALPLSLNLPLKSPYRFVVYARLGQGGGGYLLNRNAAHAFLRRSGVFTLPLDHWINRGWEFRGLKITAIDPSPMTYDDSQLSDIGEERRFDERRSYWQKKRQRLTSQMIQLKSFLSSLTYALYIYLTDKPQKHKD